MVFYNKLSDLCTPRTVAITSNTKFFTPLDAIYWKDWVPVYTLDGDKVKNKVHTNSFNQRRNTFNR